MDYQFIGVYCSSLVASFLFSICLCEHALIYIAKKRKIKIKTWHYSFWSKIWIAVSVVFCVVFGINQYQHLVYTNFIKSAIAACVCVFLKQKEDSGDALINYFQNDIESIGAFWAYQAYDAYYKFVLEDIRERMEMFEKENEIHFEIKKLILIVPLSCNTKQLLTDKDENIKYIENLPHIECDQGANINRTYKNPVYKIISNEDIYIVAEFPSPLTTLLKIKDNLGEKKFRYHRRCFVKTLKRLLEDKPCIIAEYDDTAIHPIPLNKFLLLAINEKECDQLCMDISC